MKKKAKKAFLNKKQQQKNRHFTMLKAHKN